MIIKFQRKLNIINDISEIDCILCNRNTILININIDINIEDIAILKSFLII